MLNLTLPFGFLMSTVAFEKMRIYKILKHISEVCYTGFLHDCSKWEQEFFDGHGCLSLVKVLTISVDREKGFFFLLFIFLVLMSYSRYMHRKKENW
jgi:hypothetical protein